MLRRRAQSGFPYPHISSYVLGYYKTERNEVTGAAARGTALLLRRYQG